MVLLLKTIHQLYHHRCDFKLDPYQMWGIEAWTEDDDDDDYDFRGFIGDDYVCVNLHDFCYDPRMLSLNEVIRVLGDG